MAIIDMPSVRANWMKIMTVEHSTRWLDLIRGWLGMQTSEKKARSPHRRRMAFGC